MRYASALFVLGPVLVSLVLFTYPFLNPVRTSDLVERRAEVRQKMAVICLSLQLAQDERDCETVPAFDSAAPTTRRDMRMPDGLHCYRNPRMVGRKFSEADKERPLLFTEGPGVQELWPGTSRVSYP